MQPEESAEDHEAIIDSRRRLRKRRRRLVIVALLLVTLPFVPRLLATWDSPPSRAQAIYVFPGQVPERAECGAALYVEGVAPRVVFSGGRVDAELEAIGETIDDASLNARIAHERGVPRHAEVLLHTGSSTWEDAIALGSWMEAQRVRRVIAVTSPTHSRRAAYTLRMALGDLADEIHVYRCGSIYGPLWWTRERSLVRVTLETLKFGFYVLRYFVPAAVGIDPTPVRGRGGA